MSEASNPPEGMMSEASNPPEGMMSEAGNPHFSYLYLLNNSPSQ